MWKNCDGNCVGRMWYSAASFSVAGYRCLVLPGLSRGKLSRANRDKAGPESIRSANNGALCDLVRKSGKTFAGTTTRSPCTMDSTWAVLARARSRQSRYGKAGLKGMESGYNYCSDNDLREGRIRRSGLSSIQGKASFTEESLEHDSIN